MRDSPQPGRHDGRARADRVSQKHIRAGSDQGRSGNSHGKISGQEQRYRTWRKPSRLVRASEWPCADTDLCTPCHRRVTRPYPSASVRAVVARS